MVSTLLGKMDKFGGKNPDESAKFLGHCETYVTAQIHLTHADLEANLAQSFCLMLRGTPIDYSNALMGRSHGTRLGLA